jgi:dolichyl-phosphate-mannose--protein O-mannosyl transferase
LNSILANIKANKKHFALSSIIVIFGMAIRFFNLGNPQTYVFDETYYVKDAISLIQNGSESGFFVHPELGKLLISLPMRFSSLDNSFLWRASAAIFGTICIALVTVLVKKVLCSWTFGNFAGFLFAIDGVAIVMSRVALLDIFLTAFVLAGVISVLYKKSFLAGVMFGLGCAVKWSALYFLIFFFFYYLIKEKRQYFKNILFFTVVPFFVYLATWIPYLVNSKAALGKNFFERLWVLADFHRQIYNFHANLTAAHSYSSSAWQWITMSRPTAMYYNSTLPDQMQCGGSASCVEEIISLGNLFIWWGGAVAILFLIISLFIPTFRRRLTSGKIIICLSGIAAGLIPWLPYPNRPTFQFYSILILPFIILSFVAVIHYFLLLNYDELYFNNNDFDSALSLDRSYNKSIIMPLFIIGFLTFIVSIYFYPVWLSIPISYEKWRQIVFFPSWI